MRRVPITITLPENLIRDLHSYVPRGQVSSFISRAVFGELLARKNDLMAVAFREAAEDQELDEEFEIWDTCVGDGIDETNEYKTR